MITQLDITSIDACKKDISNTKPSAWSLIEYADYTYHKGKIELTIISTSLIF